MKAPAPRIKSHIEALVENPARLVGHYRDIVSYKRGLSELADMMLNIPCDNLPWEKFAEVMAMTYWRWKKEQDFAIVEATDYDDWVRNYLRPDLVAKMRMLLQL